MFDNDEHPENIPEILLLLDFSNGLISDNDEQP